MIPEGKVANVVLTDESSTPAVGKRTAIRDVRSWHAAAKEEEAASGQTETKLIGNGAK